LIFGRTSWPLESVWRFNDGADRPLARLRESWYKMGPDATLFHESRIHS